jgi:hypothetical protein
MCLLIRTSNQSPADYIAPQPRRNYDEHNHRRHRTCYAGDTEYTNIRPAPTPPGKNSAAKPNNTRKKRVFMVFLFITDAPP